MKNYNLLVFLSLLILSSCSNIVFIWNIQDIIAMVFISVIILFVLYIIISIKIKQLTNYIKKKLSK